MTNAQDARLLADGWQAISDDGFIGLVGPFYQRVQDGTPHFLFPTDARHRNLRGVLQGGALMTFADRSLGITARFHTKAARTATVQLDVQFVDATQIGETVAHAPQLVRATRSLVFLRTELMAAQRVVGIAQGVWKILA